jgi:hypothetical protein
MEAKTGDAQRTFERLCEKAGGVNYVLGSAAKCRLMLVQQYTYFDTFVASIRANIVAEEIWGMLTLASVGLDVQDAFLKQFEVSRLTVPDKKLAKFLLNARDACSRYKELEMIEVGLPFQKYPVFEEFAVDWVVAAPTLFSFHTEAGKQGFLRSVLKLMEQIPESDVIVYKSHNGNAKDYFTPRIYAKIARLSSWVPNAEWLLSGIKLRLPPWIQVHFSRVLTALLHARVTQRAIPMIKLTPVAYMSLEAFLPGVRKGIIGGESNTIWGALFFGLPYYNCVPPNERSEGESELLKKSSDKLLEMNLKYFGVPYCHGLIDHGVIRLDLSLEMAGNNNIVDLILGVFEA